jgi:hypothetical protein
VPAPDEAVQVARIISTITASVLWYIYLILQVHLGNQDAQLGIMQLICDRCVFHSIQTTEQSFALVACCVSSECGVIVDWSFAIMSL